MRDFERLLSDLPKPAVELPQFRRRLRRELLAAEMQPEHRRYRGMRLALVAACACAAACAMAVGLFVLRPELPARLHAALSATPPARTQLSSELDAVPLSDTGASVARDRAFIDQWSAGLAQPVGVRAMESEAVYTIRQFELTNGKRILVFTELGQEQPSYRAAMAEPARRSF